MGVKVGYSVIIDSGLEVQGSRFRVRGSGFEVQGSRFRAQSSGFEIRYSTETPAELKLFPNSNRIIWGLRVTLKE